MSLLQRAKTLVLRHIEKLPRPAAIALMQLNRDPNRVFGKAYAEHRAHLARTAASYDNTGDLLRAVRHAIETVPYYRTRYRDLDVGSVEEFVGEIGFIDRDIVAADMDSFISTHVDRSTYDLCTTGGTSGRPLRLLAPKNRYVVELATMHTLWGRAGFAFEARAVTRNKRLPSSCEYVVNPITREVIFDGFRLDPQSLARVLVVIQREGIRFIHAYPSTAYELARQMQRQGWPAQGMTFLSGSENVFPYQRKLIVNELGARFYNWYGHTEKLVLAGHCEHTTDYHVEPTYGFFELVDDTGRPITTPGVTGEIVGTSLHNPGMPLLRYRTGDRAEYVGDHCVACGRRVPVFRDVAGRWNGEKIFITDDRYVTTTALNLHDELLSVLHGLQYVQEKVGDVTVLVVKSPQFTRRHDEALRAHYRDKLGGLQHLEIRYVDTLQRHRNGKVTHLISSVDRP